MTLEEANDGIVEDVAKKGLHYIQYSPHREEEYVTAIRELISDQLSEPYSIYVYRYFLYQWGDLCFMAVDDADQLIGVVVSKLEPHRGGPLRGYIAMLAVRSEWRGRGIATKLVRRALDAMIERNAEEVVLEAETTNAAAMKLYERLGFLRSKRLHRYYLNGNTAYRFVLYVKATPATMNQPPGWEMMDVSVSNAVEGRTEDGAETLKKEATTALCTGDDEAIIRASKPEDTKSKPKAKPKGKSKRKSKS